MMPLESSARDDLDRRGECFVGDGVHVRRRLRRDRFSQQVYGFVHLASVGVGGAPPVQVGAGSDQREYGVGQFGHGDDCA
jgi:hypothetical protein